MTHDCWDTASSRARYTQVATSTIRGTPSPLDRLRLEVTPP
jgi:integrase/recombinase XerD